jgi:hypothetical protein
MRVCLSARLPPASLPVGSEELPIKVMHPIKCLPHYILVQTAFMGQFAIVRAASTKGMYMTT